MIGLMTRRTALAGLACTASALTMARASEDPNAQLAAIEAKAGGRLGVAILDTATGRRFGHRTDERFALCSTFKFLVAAHVLARVDRNEEHLDRRVTFAEKDVIAYSPATKDHVGAGGMTIAQLCDAAVTLSDNTAANVLLRGLGGPAGLTAYVRTLSDTVTRLDRNEPDLNNVGPGDTRDTTTPAAMLETMRKIALADVLSTQSREQIIAWMVASKTGAKRLRAGLPKDWRVGDKTGTGSNGEANDIAVIWPARGAPVLVTAYYAGAKRQEDEGNAVLAEVGRIVAGATAKPA